MLWVSFEGCALFLTLVAGAGLLEEWGFGLVHVMECCAWTARKSEAGGGTCVVFLHVEF